MDPIEIIIGKFGKWQFKVYLISCSFGFCFAMHLLSMTFLTPEIDHWCAKPEPWKNVTEEMWKNKVMIDEKNDIGEIIRSKCNMYDFPFENITEEEFSMIKLTENNNTVKCKNYKFDDSEYTNTLVHKWQLVCDRDILISTANSIGMLGLLVGVFVLGQLSDMFGRRPVILIGNVTWIITSTLTCFCTYYEVFVILRFISLGMAVGIFTVAFIILAECSSDRNRASWGNAKGFGFALGFVLLAGIGYLVKSWVYLQAIIIIPLVILFIINFFFLPESPRWLIMNGKYFECIKVMNNIIKVNKLEKFKDVKDEDLLMSLKAQHDMLVHAKKNENKKTAFDLLKTPKLRIRSLIMFYTWFVTSLVYYAQSLSAGNLGGNKYINFFIAGAVEVPAVAIVIICTLKFGRKKSLIFFNAVGGLGCFLTIAVPNDMVWLRITFAMIGKFGMSATFPLIYTYGSELFPTPVRNVGVGTSSMFARVGTALSPFVKELELLTNRHVPQGIAGTFAFICILFAWFLPETSNRKLPETIEELENEGFNTNDKELLDVNKEMN